MLSLFVSGFGSVEVGQVNTIGASVVPGSQTVSSEGPASLLKGVCSQLN